MYKDISYSGIASEKLMIIIIVYCVVDEAIVYA